MMQRVALLWLALASPALASELELIELQRLTSQAPAAGDRYGSAVSFAGDRLAVGMPYSDPVGRVLVYARNGAEWTEEASLVAPLPGPLPSFGLSLSGGDHTLAVGAPTDSTASLESGAVHLFERNGTSWTASASLTSPGAYAGERFGSSIDFDETERRLVVGSPGGVATSAAGAVHVYTEVAGVWTLEASLRPANSEPEDHFGSQVVVDGDRIAVASLRLGDLPLPGHRRVYTFRREGSSWVQDAKLDNPGSPLYDGFGWDLALRGGRLAVGNPQSNQVFVYTAAAIGWSAPMVLQGPSFSFFGSSVALHDDYLLIGRRFDEELDGSEGTASLFRLEGAGWTELAWFRGSQPESARMFGDQVALNGRELAIADALADVPPMIQTGAVHAFSYGEEFATPFCFGDGTGAACPCGNASDADAGQGCRNSTGRGARLWLVGSASVGADDLVAFADGIQPGQPALLFGGDAQLGGGDGVPFGDGLRCAGGVVDRLEIAPASGNEIASFGPGLITAGAWSPGDVRSLQAWYRDSVGSPCAASFNLSNGVVLELTL